MARMLQELFNESRTNGWAVGQGTIEQVQFDAAMLGWTVVPTRRGGPDVATLRPVNQAEAEPKSLSAVYGKGAQPLHTDGAHLPEPPDIVILTCETTSTTPTRLWNGGYSRFTPVITPGYIDHGVFLVSSGNDSFFTTAGSAGRYRYDLGCMVPCDARARKVVQFFNEAEGATVEHVWSAPGQILLIDNRRVLHARSSAVDDPQREIKRISFHLKRGA